MQVAEIRDRACALEHSTADTVHEMCKMSQTWTLGSRVSRRESRTTQRRKVRPTCGETWGKLKRVHHCSTANGTKTFLTRRHSFLSTPEKSCGTLVPKRDSLGNSNLINGVICSRNTVSKSIGARKSQNPQVELEARRNQSVFVCASWFGWVQWHHPIHCCGAGFPTSTAGGDNEDTPS